MYPFGGKAVRCHDRCSRSPSLRTGFFRKDSRNMLSAPHPEQARSRPPLCSIPGRRCPTAACGRLHRTRCPIPNRPPQTRRNVAVKHEHNAVYPVVQQGAVDCRRTVRSSFASEIKQNTRIRPCIAAVPAKADGPANMVRVISRRVHACVGAGDGNAVFRR